MELEDQVLKGVLDSAPLRLSDVLNDSIGSTGDTPAANYSIVAGSFRSLSLVLLAFSPFNNSLRCVKRIEGFGPHQYLTALPHRDAVLTTSWAHPPIISSWRLLRDEGHREIHGIKHIENMPISATSSYISVPPPYNFTYSVGGPTGEVHSFSATTDGILGSKTQDLLFVPAEDLEKADKTRVALRYGSHGIEFSTAGYAFVPVLGGDRIEMYRRDYQSGKLEHLYTGTSPRGPEANDGPRHVKVHPNGKVLYCVTEHTNFLDVYEILKEPPSLKHISGHSILPQHLQSSQDVTESSDPHLKSVHRGGTLMLTPSTSSHPAPRGIFTTTRGTKGTNGWVSLFKLDADGHVSVGSASNDDVIRYETPTSTGKANALDVRPIPGEAEGVWVLLTDDDKEADDIGAVRVLEWQGWSSKEGLRVIAEWPSGSSRGREECAVEKTAGTLERDDNGAEQVFRGASHAVWLD